MSGFNGVLSCLGKKCFSVNSCFVSVSRDKIKTTLTIIIVLEPVLAVVESPWQPFHYSPVKRILDFSKRRVKLN